MNIFDRIFPKRYDFYSLLREQSKTNFLILKGFEHWLVYRDEDSYNEVFVKKVEADKVRFKLEDDLVKAFSTPFDRQELYSISVNMNKIAHFTKLTLKKIQLLEIESDSTILSMAKLLTQGALGLSEGIEILETNPSKTQDIINNIRLSQKGVEDIHIFGLKALYDTKGPLEIIKYKEIYETLLKATSSLEDTVDIYHRICVRLV